MGMGFPKTARQELMTPAAMHAAGCFATRRKAGFFVHAAARQIGQRRE